MNKETREFILYLVLSVILLIGLHLKKEMNSTPQIILYLTNSILLTLCVTKLFKNIKN